ncbi:MAG: CsbD family protein [Candidatus Peribacteraceae bacterium]|jgi:uncharacterized protein YjbJ (UPF0337 family)
MADERKDIMDEQAQKAVDEGQWDRMVGKAKSLWGELTDDDFMEAKGDMQSFFGMIEQKTGETIQSIKEKLEWKDEEHGGMEKAE